MSDGDAGIAIAANTGIAIWAISSTTRVQYFADILRIGIPVLECADAHVYVLEYRDCIGLGILVLAFGHRQDRNQNWILQNISIVEG